MTFIVRFFVISSSRLSKHNYIQGGPKKLRQIFSCNNFGKYGPILIMFSLLHSQMN